jgi:hypothetical protein
MNTDKMREEFEAWVVSNWPNQSLDRFNPLHGVTEGEYTGFTVQHCWDAWQASRAALAVNLPKPLPSGDYRMTVPFYKAADVHEALSAAGIEVKA